MWAGVASGQRGGRSWRIDGQRPRGTVMEGSLGERPKVPGGGTVVRADRFASIEPRKRAVQQRWATHLTTVRWRWVSLHGPNRVPVVRMVALSVDIKQYIHIFRKLILRRVHVGVSQSWVMCLRMLADRVMGHPTVLLRTYFHRLFFLTNVHTLTDTHNTKVQKSPNSFFV